MATRQDVVNEAKKWLGARWEHQQCLQYKAADCGMILIDIFATCGIIERPKVEPYPRDWALHQTDERYLGYVEQHCKKVLHRSPLPGDIAIWKFGNTYSHGAVVIDWPLILHAQVKDGVVLADASCGSLSSREVLFYSAFDEGDL